MMENLENPAVAVERKKPGLILALVACAMGVLGIITPFIALIFVALTIVLALIATIKGFKSKYWPTVGFAVLAWVLIVIGLATSPIFLAIVLGQKVTNQAVSFEAAPTPTAAPATPESMPPTSAATPAADYTKICEDKMTAYAEQNHADPKQYIEQNQAYLQQCAQSLAATSAATEPTPAAQ